MFIQSFGAAISNKIAFVRYYGLVVMRYVTVGGLFVLFTIRIVRIIGFWFGFVEVIVILQGVMTFWIRVYSQITCC